MRTVWFWLKGTDQPAMVTVDVNTNIFQLKKAVHAEFPNELAGIDSGKLKIFLKKGAAEAWC
jgi:hypothetical protein